LLRGATSDRLCLPTPRWRRLHKRLGRASEVAFEVAPRFLRHGPRVEDEDMPTTPCRRIAIQPCDVLTIGLVHLLDFGRRVGDGLAVLVEQAEPRHLAARDSANLILTLEEDEVGRRDRDLHPTRFRITIRTRQEHVTGREELARVEATQRLIAPRNDGFAFGEASASFLRSARSMS
jgi:hypothetical protein